MSFLFLFAGTVLQPTVTYAATATSATPAQTTAKSADSQQTKPDTVVGEGDIVSSFIVKVLGGFLKPVFTLEGIVIAMLTRILMDVVKYNDFVSSPPVQVGWTLVRDVANLFFVVLLLAVALGTILKTESYNFKRLLPKLLIMAGLVNFSLVIAGLFIDFAQVIMMTFVSAFTAVTGEGNLIAALHVDKIIFYNSTNPNWAVGSMQLLVTLIFMILMLLIVIIVILVMLVVFVMRIVMLWLLLVLAPLPYIMAAWGGSRAQRYYQQWWDEFFKYVMVGPVLAFFLWLALAVGTSDKLLGNINPAALNSQAAQSSYDSSITGILTTIGDPKQLVTFIIVVSLLMASLMITQQLGVAGGSFAGNMMGKIRGAGMSVVGAGVAGLKAPFKAFGKGINVAEKALYGTTGIGLNPARMVRGLKESFGGWEKRMERQGGIRGGEKAKSLLTYTPDTKLGKAASMPIRALGAGGLLMTSPKDFSSNFGLFRGLARLGKTVWRGTNVKELKEWKEDKKLKERELESKEKLGWVGDVSEQGKTVLAKKSADLLTKLRQRDEGAVVSTINPGKSSVEEVMSDITQKRLTELQRYAEPGLDIRNVELGRIGEEKAGGKGIKNEEDFNAVYKAIENEYGEKMVKDGKYIADDGSIQKITPEVLAAAGTAYYDDAIKKKDEDIKRAGEGGITDAQLGNRQSTLEDLNYKILQVLKEIKSSGRNATRDEEFKVKTLIEQGLKLGGTARIDSVTGLQHFGVKDDDYSSTQRLAHSNVTGNAARTEQELKATNEKDELGQSMVDKFKLELDYLKAAKDLASLTPAERQKKQEEIREAVQAEKETIKSEDKERKEKGIAAPILYEALAEMRAAEAEEIKRLPDSMEWTEVEDELANAMQLKNVAKIRALIRKAAIDYNDNEVLLAHGFEATAKGMRNFGDTVLQKGLGMSRGEMLHFMNDIAYINEDKGHYDTSRMVGIENGVPKWLTEIEHAKAAANENMKKDSRKFLQTTNRLGYGGEDTKGNYRISLEGQLTLASIGDFELANRITRGEMNPSALSKIASDVKTLQKMVDKRWLKQKTVDTIKEYAAKRAVQAGFRGVEIDESENL